MRWWKWIGLAGLAGVAATGAVIARDARQRNAYTPDEVRSRLHDRAAEALSDDEEPADVPVPGSGGAASADAPATDQQA